MKLRVRARICCKEGYQAALVGNLAELGGWQPTRALKMALRENGLWQLTAPVLLPQGVTFEFKLIQLGAQGQVLWQELPHNKNRHYAIHEDVVLTMQWSCSVGERKKLKARRVYSETNTSMLLSEPIKRSTTILTDNFNPFEFAEYSDEEDDQVCAAVNRATPLSGYGRNEFEELFYSSNDKISLLKQLTQNYACRFYVASVKHPQESEFCRRVRNELVTEGLQDQAIAYVPLRRKSGGLSDSNLLWLFQRHIEEIPDYSVVLITDIRLVRLKLGSTCFKGIIVPGQQELDSLPSRLEQFCRDTLVVCESAQATKQRLKQSSNNLQNRELYNEFLESIWVQQMSITRALFRFLSERAAWQSYEHDDSIKSIAIHELQHIIDSHFNSILVFDWEVLESCMARIGNYYTFLDGLRMLSREHGEFVVIVSEKSRAELEDKLGFLLVSNITLFLNSGREVRVNGTWIHPYEKLDGTIEYFRRKVYNYQREVGGEVKETANCLTYHCVEDGLLPEASFFSPSQRKYIKNSHDARTLSISWEYDHRTALEVILRLNCMTQGSVGSVFAVVRDQKKSYIFDCLNYFSKAYPYFFTQHCRWIFASEGTTHVRSCTSLLSLEDLKSLKLLSD